MTLREFRERIEADRTDCDEEEWGGCACFTPDTYEQLVLIGESDV